MKRNKKKKGLFKIKEKWNEHWDGMPEFKQENLKPYNSIIVNFETKKDFMRFAKLMKQNLSKKTKYIYFPKQTRYKLKNLKYVDSED